MKYRKGPALAGDSGNSVWNELNWKHRKSSGPQKVVQIYLYTQSGFNWSSSDKIRSQVIFTQMLYSRVERRFSGFTVSTPRKWGSLLCRTSWNVRGLGDLGIGSGFGDGLGAIVDLLQFGRVGMGSGIGWDLSFTMDLGVEGREKHSVTKNL